MEQAKLEEKVEMIHDNNAPLKTRHKAYFILTNSDKIGFTKRDLALCFYPNEVTFGEAY